MICVSTSGGMVSLNVRDVEETHIMRLYKLRC